jgi:hypothetical protein
MHDVRTSFTFKYVAIATYILGDAVVLTCSSRMMTPLKGASESKGGSRLG